MADNSFIATGIVAEITDVIEINENFKKKVFVIENKGESNGKEWTEMMAFEVINDKIDLIKNLKKDENVKVYFNINSRQSGSNYFTTLRPWKIEENKD